MSLAANIESPPSSLGEGCDFITESLKDKTFSQKNEVFDLKKLAYISTFEQMSFFVAKMSNGKKYIACPKGSSAIDQEECLNKIQEPIFKALQNINKRRKNGRDIKLIKAAALGDYLSIVNIIASSAWTYWQNNGFFSGKNLHNELIAVSQFKNIENNSLKREFLKAQIDNMGVIIDFIKTKKKGAFQEFFDFDETIKFLNNIDFEDFE